MQNRKFMAQAILLAAALCSLPSLAAPPHYRVDLIGDPAVDGEVWSGGLNNLGEVVGIRFYPGAVRVPFVYKDGRITTPDFHGQFQAFILSGINDRGDLAGSILKDNRFIPFVYRNGKAEDLSAYLGPNYGQVLAINQAGHVVGYSTSEQGQDRAFYNDELRTRIFDEFDISFVDINDHDVIAHSKGFLVDDGRVKVLPPLSPDFKDINVRALNNRGEVVGTAYNAALDQSMPYLYSGGVMRALGSLGGTYGVARDVNDAGWVVGEGVAQADDLDAFLYRDGALYNLEDLLAPKDRGLWDFHGAQAINERGQILVSFAPWLESGYRSALLTPVPEAHTWALMFTGLGVVCAVAGRRRRTAPTQLHTA